jgi:uncharacterized Ntn-hydrolase superfamily protein
MMKKLFLILSIISFQRLAAQDTFSIVAVDSITGEVGSAGASCVDLFNFPTFTADFLGELFPGVGAINTQAAYLQGNQVLARERMVAGDTPAQIISYMQANDVAVNPHIRQYGVVRLVNNSPQAAAYTGVFCTNYKNHKVGKNYAIQGNILLNQAILDSMEARFLREPGDLACKLMAALQGANVVGADTRCASNNSSSLFAFLKVANPDNEFNEPSFIVSVKTASGAQIEPIDSLQSLFNAQRNCEVVSKLNIQKSKIEKLIVYPNPATDILTISLNHLKAGKIKIYNPLGLLVKEVEEIQTNTSTNIEIANLAKGIYTLEFSNQDKIISQKLVVQ